MDGRRASEKGRKRRRKGKGKGAEERKGKGREGERFEKARLVISLVLMSFRDFML